MVIDKQVAHESVCFSAYMGNGIEEAFGATLEEVNSSGEPQEVVFDLWIDSDWEEIPDDAPIVELSDTSPFTTATILPGMTFETFRQLVDIKQRLSGLIKIQSGAKPMDNITISSEQDYLEGVVEFLRQHRELSIIDGREIFNLYKRATLILTGLHIEKSKLELGIASPTIESQLLVAYQGC